MISFTKRITKDTPLTINEVDKNDLKKQIKIKQKIKGKSNLNPFKAKGGSMKTMKQLMNSFEIDDKLYKKTSKLKNLTKFFMKFHTKTIIILWQIYYFYQKLQMIINIYWL